MAELVRGEAPDASAGTDTPDHPHQRLVACRHLRILPSPEPLDRRDPELDLDGENVVVELGLELPERAAELRQHVRVERKNLPMLALAENTNAPAHQVD